MKPERAFVAERPLAQHCPELVRQSPELVDLLPSLAILGERMTRIFAASFARLPGSGLPLVRCGAPRYCSMSDLTDEIAPLAANSLLAIGNGEAGLLVSLDAGAVLRLVDRAFGGKGDAPSPLPDTFPVSAELLIFRLETMIADAIATAHGISENHAIRPLRRDGSLTVDEAGRVPWSMTLALPLDSLTELLGYGEQGKPARPKARTELGHTTEPMESISLTIEAVLVDMQLSVSSLSLLKPGQVLPVSVARSVPLRIGDKTIAHGTIGEMDDRVAVQITNAF